MCSYATKGLYSDGQQSTDINKIEKNHLLSQTIEHKHIMTCGVEKIQVLTWDRHKCVTRLNRIMRSLFYQTKCFLFIITRTGQSRYLWSSSSVFHFIFQDILTMYKDLILTFDYINVSGFASDSSIPGCSFQWSKQCSLLLICLSAAWFTHAWYVTWQEQINLK